MLPPPERGGRRRTLAREWGAPGEGLGGGGPFLCFLVGALCSHTRPPTDYEAGAPLDALGSACLRPLAWSWAPSLLYRVIACYCTSVRRALPPRTFPFPPESLPAPPPSLTDGGLAAGRRLTRSSRGGKEGEEGDDDPSTAPASAGDGDADGRDGQLAGKKRRREDSDGNLAASAGGVGGEGGAPAGEPPAARAAGEAAAPKPS